MRAANLHIIQKQTIKINFDSMDGAAGLQNLIAEVFYEKIQPRMEVLLDEMFGKNQYASIDKIEIDCGLLDMQNWELEFADRAILKLKDELNQVNKGEINQENIEETAAEEAFFFFLGNGFMPWNKRIESIAELEKLLRINEKMIDRLKKLIAQKSKTAERLVWQFSKNFTSRIIAEITKDRENALTEIFSLLEKLNLLQTGKLINALTQKQIDSHIVDAAILKLLASDENKARVEQFFSFLLTNIAGNKELKAEISEIINYLRTKNRSSSLSAVENKMKPVAGKNEKEEVSLRKDRTEIPPGEIYISNAGLVLLHPFLEALFEQLGLTTENNWIDAFSKHEAVLASEFLVTGNTEIEEFNLVLNKILCGIGIDEIVPTTIKLDEETKTECNNLLKAVIKHWEVLKNTSIDGLREAFLQRNGKLTRVDNGWLLQVEQKAIDVLLNHLPWGIGMVKLPWTNEILHVEWA